MTAADVPLGMELKRFAGWNQTEADWRRLLDLEPDGCFVAELDGTPSATLATCIFGAVAWIAMVLVQPQAVRVVRQGGQVLGFLTERPGTEALLIGPCVATVDAGPLLLRDAFERHAGQRVYLDVPERNGRALTLAAARGLTVQRQLVR